MIGCQYSPDEWPEMMVETKKKGCRLIRRRLVNNDIHRAAREELEEDLMEEEERKESLRLILDIIGL